MENKKKNYLFRLGPLLFFPKDQETNQRSLYADGKEADKNVIRLILIVMYVAINYALIRKFSIGDIFTEPERIPFSIFLLFFVPGFFSIIELILLWKDRKTNTRRPKTSYYFIYGELFVSATFYSIYLYHLIFK